MRNTQREAEIEKAPHAEPDARLDPKTPGSQPEPKADAQPLSHSGASCSSFSKLFWLFSLSHSPRNRSDL